MAALAFLRVAPKEVGIRRLQCLLARCQPIGDGESPTPIGANRLGGRRAL